MLRLVACLGARSRDAVPDRSYEMPVRGEVVSEDSWKWERDARVVGRMKPVVSLMDALDDAEEALLRAYLRSGWDDIRKALALIVRLKDSNTGTSCDG